MAKLTFIPVEWRYRKFHNNIIIKKLKKKEFKHYYLKKGELGLKSINNNVIDSKQLLSFLKILVKLCKKEFKFWFYCFPNISITAKGISVRMGAGIGSIINWVYVIKKNCIFLELIANSLEIMMYALKKAKKKLKVKNKIIINKKNKKKNEFYINR